MLWSFITCFLFLTAHAESPKSAFLDDIYRVDTQRSSATWKGFKGSESHQGVLSIKSGEFIFQGDQLIQGQLVVDMNSIKNTDLKDPKQSKALEEDLKSANFFASETYPESRFVFDEVESLGGGKYSLKGQVFLRDRVGEESFDVKLNRVGKKLVAVANVTLDRSKYDVVYSFLKKSEDSFFKKVFKWVSYKFIKKEFDLTLNLVADQK